MYTEHRSILNLQIELSSDNFFKCSLRKAPQNNRHCVQYISGPQRNIYMYPSCQYEKLGIMKLSSTHFTVHCTVCILSHINLCWPQMTFHLHEIGIIYSLIGTVPTYQVWILRNCLILFTHSWGRGEVSCECWGKWNLRSVHMAASA